VVWGVVVSARVVGLEGLEELHQDLVFGLLALNHIRVFGRVVNALDVVDVNVAISVFVYLAVSLSDNLLPSGVHGPSQLSQEFIVVARAGAVNIEEGEELLDLLSGEAEHVIGHGLGELV